MRRDRLSVVRPLCGLLLGLVIWFALDVPYNRFLAGTAEPLLRLFERPPVTRLIAEGEEITIDRTDFRSGSRRPALLANQLTANFVLLVALFAANAKPLSTHNVTRFAIASLVLMLGHILAVIVNVESIYALNLGPWSVRHYGVVARNVWSTAAHFYTLIGSYALAFALWWTL